MTQALILMYHSIGEPPEGVKTPNLYVTPKMFKFQMWYLQWAGFNVMSLKDLIASAQNDEEKAKRIAITFDDGYQDFYENAYPVLKRHGYPSTVFIIPGLIGGKNAWDFSSENADKPLMDWETVIEISNKGVEIGSHTQTHPCLLDLSPLEIAAEAIDSKREIEKRLSRPVEFFCYPYGKYNAGVREGVRKAGYTAAISTLRGCVENPFDLFGLKRVPVKLTTNPLSFIYRIHKAY